MGLSRKLCILGKKLAKKAKINGFLPDIFGTIEGMIRMMLYAEF